MPKSTPAEIEARFDVDVERFSDLAGGQATIPDSALAQDLLVEVAARHNPRPSSLLDIGCGAGNLTLRLLRAFSAPPERVRLVDLSGPMLARAEERVRGSGYQGEIEVVKGDLGKIDLGGPHDVIATAAALHHLRDEEEWRAGFVRIHAALAPEGLLIVHDMVATGLPAAAAVIRERYGAHLTALRDEAYRDHVFAYIEREDTPESLANQLSWLREAGFAGVDVLHARDGFAAYVAVA